jgi:glycosyltransferase involved in cell wall biosynthesis
MAYGVSTLFICQALRDKGGGHHTAIDPEQHSTWQSIGMLNLKRAGYENLVTVHPTFDYVALPRLLERGEVYAFAFIDGMHASWSDDEAAIRRRPNIRLIDSVDDIDEVYEQTRVLLVPTLCFEVFGQATVEAMQHGMPVLASDSSGLREAKLGVPYLLPVTPITSYLPASGELLMRPVVPPQDIGPWLRTLDRLLTDEGHYRGLAEASAVAAAEYVAGCSLEPLHRAIEQLAGPRRSVQAGTA